MGRLRCHSIVYGIVLFVSQALWTPRAKAEPPRTPSQTTSGADSGSTQEAPQSPAGKNRATTPVATPPANDEDTSTATQSQREKEAREKEAREAFQRGDKLYLESDYEGAVAAFEEAYAKSGRIEMLFNLANAQERLGNYSEAALLLRGYIPHSPESHRPALERRLERLERLAERQKTNALPPAAAPSSEEHDGLSWPRVVGIGLTTLGGAALITGVGFAISAAQTRSQLDELCVEGESGRLCTPEADNLLERDKAHSIVADVAFLGGALLTTAGVVLLVAPKKKDHERGPQVQAGPGLFSVWLRGTF